MIMIKMLVLLGAAAVLLAPFCSAGVCPCSPRSCSRSVSTSAFLDDDRVVPGHAEEIKWNDYIISIVAVQFWLLKWSNNKSSENLVK